MPDISDRLVGAVNAHDVDALLRCYNPRAVILAPEVQAETPEQIASYFSHVWEGFPDVRLTILEKTATESFVVIEALSTGTHRGPYLVAGGETLAPTGRHVSVRTCWVCTLEEGVILSQRLYYDQLEVYIQLGMRSPSQGLPFY